MAFKKGHERVGGRQKGSINKTTNTMKEIMFIVFDKIGGIPRFAKWADENPDRFFEMMMKLIPYNINMDGKVAHEVKRFTPDMLATMAAEDGRILSKLQLITHNK